VISNPLGALIGGTLAELFGRRMTLLIAAFPYVVGWLLISVSTDLYWLGAGRFVTGFAVGKQINFISSVLIFIFSIPRY
jgi:MFS family permease